MRTNYRNHLKNQIWIASRKWRWQTIRYATMTNANCVWTINQAFDSYLQQKCCWCNVLLPQSLWTIPSVVLGSCRLDGEAVTCPTALSRVFTPGVSTTWTLTRFEFLFRFHSFGRSVRPGDLFVMFDRDQLWSVFVSVSVQWITKPYVRNGWKKQTNTRHAY